MVARLASVTGFGSLDLLATSAASSGPPTLPLVWDDTLTESGTVASPISNADMQNRWLPVSYGGTSNYVNTSVVNATGPSGTAIKALQQNFTTVPQYGMPPTGEGLALTSAPLGATYTEAVLEYDFRAVSSGVPWGEGGKLPGLGGVVPGHGGVPTGGSPSVYGWSSRFMFRRFSNDPTGINPAARLVLYVYDPTQPAGAIGQDRETNKTMVASRWYHMAQYHRMNTVVTDGNTNPPADGIHRAWLDGNLWWDKPDQTYRYYAAGAITHICHDIFYGGADNGWGPLQPTQLQLANLKITAA